MSKNRKNVVKSVVNHAVYDTFLVIAKTAFHRAAESAVIGEYSTHAHKNGPRRTRFSFTWSDADQSQALMPLQSLMYCLIAGTSVYLFTPSVVGMTSVGTLTISSF